jgi:hypothetical protein
VEASRSCPIVDVDDDDRPGESDAPLTTTMASPAMKTAHRDVGNHPAHSFALASLRIESRSQRRSAASLRSLHALPGAALAPTSQAARAHGRLRWSAGSRRPASWNLEGIPTRMILQEISRERPSRHLLALFLFAGALTPTVDRIQCRNPVLLSSSETIGTTGVRTTRDERVDRARQAAATTDAGELSGHPRP